MFNFVLSKIPKDKICFIPIYSGIMCIITIILSYLISKSLNHYPSWMTVPFISLCGFKFPERIIYASGFTIAAFGYLLVADIYREGLTVLRLYNLY